MKRSTLIFTAGVFVAGVLLFAGCKKTDLLGSALNPVNTQMAKGGGGGGGGNGGGGGGGTEVTGNNLSFPVVWAENTTINLRVEPVTGPKTDGEWWYVWGIDPIDPQADIFSCNPALSDPCYPAGTPDVYKAYLQKDADNIWQAYNAPPTTTSVIVDQIDWGDNLESGSWSLTSKVRVEVGLYETFDDPVKEYLMRHVSGWGTDEVHGLATDLQGNIQLGPGTQATVYSTLARLTIQKLSEGATEDNLTWDGTNHMWTGDAATPLYSHAIYEGGTGPTYFGAEVNVKGKIIYGYAWDVKKTNAGAGIYRLTFSFDGAGHTDFDETTQILVAEEETEGIVIAAEPVGGVAVVDPDNNLTYIDVIITGKGSGGGGGGGKGKPTQ
ncbi:MAG: hypothetical protein ACO1OO_05615 [Flavisolibacter sp.]